MLLESTGAEPQILKTSEAFHFHKCFTKEPSRPTFGSGGAVRSRTGTVQVIHLGMA